MALLQQSQQEYYSGTDHGGYQFISLENIIDQFKIAYVGEDKIISKVSRTDVAFHAQRALQELSFDTLKSCKAQEIIVPATLQMTLPQDYVNYTKISWVDSSGIKHLLYPTSKTSNPSSNPLQNSAGEFKLQAVGAFTKNYNTVVLDGEYKDIVVGMIVNGPGPYLPSPTFVSATTNSGGVTTIELQDASGTDVKPTYSNAGTTLTFTKSDFTLVEPQKSAHIVEYLSWNKLDYKIQKFTDDTATVALNFVNVEVGMVISHDHFPVGTKVVNVYDNVVIVDKLPSNASGAGQGELTFIFPDADTDTWTNYKSATPSENQDDYQDDTYWLAEGSRFGLDPQHAQTNGSFYIDCVSGKIHFSSNISGKTVILDYISDSLGTDDEMLVHKFAEEAMYRSILHGIASNRIQTQQLVPRLKKEKFAAVRQAKLRLSNIKLEELTQILRGKSKQIKH